MGVKLMVSVIAGAEPLAANDRRSSSTIFFHRQLVGVTSGETTFGVAGEEWHIRFL